MATWSQMSIASWHAAWMLRRLKNRRSAINRVYYAAFSAVTADLRKRVMIFPKGYEHPPHIQIRQWIKRYLTQFAKVDRDELRDAIGRLYKARVDADYRQDADPSDVDVRKAFADAEYRNDKFGAAMTNITKEQAIDLVRKHLEQHQPEGYRLVVVEEATREEDDWWIVAVGSDRSDIRRYDYYDILSQIERELEDEESANISLMPPPSKAVG